MTELLSAMAIVLLLATTVAAEDPDASAKRIRDAAGECHYVLSICSDTDRAEAAVGRLRTEMAGSAEPAAAERLAAAEARAAKQVDLLNRAATSIRARHPDVPGCFWHCARLRDFK